MLDLNLIHIVKYSGTFGFLKPWTAVRDEMTFSSQILTPSTIEGLKQKLEVNEIIGHRLDYDGISKQQETVQAAGWEIKKKRNTSILIRGILINPILWLAFRESDDATRAFEQHIVLSRNEDILYPTEIRDVTPEQFNSDQFPGFEFIEVNNETVQDSNIIPVGIHRYEKSLMTGILKSFGKGLDI